MESRTGMSTKEQIEQLMTRVDEMNEKLYEFETNKKNNLIFYGIPGETRETPPVLMTKVGGLENKDILQQYIFKCQKDILQQYIFKYQGLNCCEEDPSNAARCKCKFNNKPRIVI